MAQIWHCFGCGIDRPAAVAPIQPLAWELPYAPSVALKRPKKKKKKERKKKISRLRCTSERNEIHKNKNYPICFYLYSTKLEHVIFKRR